MWATSVPILVFLGLSVLELGPMYATDRRQAKASSLIDLVLMHYSHMGPVCPFQTVVGVSTFMSCSWGQP